MHAWKTYNFIAPDKIWRMGEIGKSVMKAAQPKKLNLKMSLKGQTKLL